MTASISITLLLAAGCSGDGEKATATTTSKPAPATTETPIEVLADEAGTEYQMALADAEEIRLTTRERRDDAAEDGDVPGALAEVRRFRIGLLDFDEAVREIEFPEELADRIDELLEANGRLIADLDAYRSVTDAESYDEKVEVENEDTSLWFEAADAVAEALDVEGTQVDDGGDEPVVVGEGEVVETAGYSVVVPEGWTGTGRVSIDLDGPDDAFIRSGPLSGYSGPVADIAREYVTASAVKYEATVAREAFEAQVGSETGVGYVLDYGDGTVDMLVVSVQGDLVITFSLNARAIDLGDLEPAFFAVLASFELTD